MENRIMVKKTEVGQEPCMSETGVPCPEYMNCRYNALQCKAFRTYVSANKEVDMKDRGRLMKPLAQLAHADEA